MDCYDHVSDALRLSDELIILADSQGEKCEHDGCILIDGIIRDCAWKIRQAALQWRLDLEKHETAEGTGRGEPQVKAATPVSFRPSERSD